MFLFVCGPAPAQAGTGRVVNFLTHCKVSGEAMDDPIALHGRPGASHDHTFFGNKGVDAFSTLQTLRRSGTTCKRRSDTAAYWVPTLFRNGRPVRPIDGVAYYTLREHTRVRPYPCGLKVVAGDAHAVAAQSRYVVWWTCATPRVAGMSSDPPRDCSVGAVPAPRTAVRTAGDNRVGIQLHVRFPDCWDGHHLDSADHHSHMAYSVHGVCPHSHPELLPSLILIVTYPIASGSGTFLSSGGQYSGHADFFNAWKQRSLTRIVNDCVAGRPRCGRH